MTWILADLAVLAVLIGSTVIMSKKGLVNCFYKLGSFVITIVLVMTLTTPFYNFFCDLEISDRIDIYVEESMLGEEPEEAEEQEGLIPKFVENSVEEVAVSTVSVIVKKIICAILLYFLIKILLVVIFFILRHISKLPVISAANKLLGAFVGLLCGLVIVYIACGVIFVINANEFVESTYILKWFYDQNILLGFFV